ncbi:hypothetical protein F5146DRAFT_1002325 [Armillaria mellea]|nr:hypothetical protein F5146DRAFT_1002325 [Armillaria mellea]
MDEREFPIPPWFLFRDLFLHGSPPKISHYRRKATGFLSEESTLLCNVHSTVFNATLTFSYGKQEALQPAQEANPVTEPLAAPLPDAFLRFNAEASTVLQECEDFLEGEVPSDYVKSLLSHYFKDNSQQQGEIGIFVEPLDDLYRMQTAYKDISTKALDVDGPSNHHKKMECAGETIGQLISWLEDIWHAAKVAKRG